VLRTKVPKSHQNNGGHCADTAKKFRSKGPIKTVGKGGCQQKGAKAKTLLTKARQGKVEKIVERGVLSREKGTET